jgi:hypothetical protein
MKWRPRKLAYTEEAMFPSKEDVLISIAAKTNAEQPPFI